MLKIFIDVTTSIFTPAYYDERRVGEVVKQFNISKFSAGIIGWKFAVMILTSFNPLLKC